MRHASPPISKIQDFLPLTLLLFSPFLIVSIAAQLELQTDYSKRIVTRLVAQRPILLEIIDSIEASSHVGYCVRRLLLRGEMALAGF